VGLAGLNVVIALRLRQGAGRIVLAIEECIDKGIYAPVFRTFQKRLL